MTILSVWTISRRTHRVHNVVSTATEITLNHPKTPCVCRVNYTKPGAGDMWYILVSRFIIYRRWAAKTIEPSTKSCTTLTSQLLASWASCRI